MFKKLFNKIEADFDITVYLRYWPILKKITTLNNPKLSVAEIGSGSFGIGPYLKRPFTGFDIAFGKKKSTFLKPVVSSAVKIPTNFNKKFNLVISVDMLEHLSPENRLKALQKMVSLTNQHLLVAFPSGRVAFLADKILNWYYQRTHQEKFDFLTEHLRFPLPDVKSVKNQLIKIARKDNREIIFLEAVGNTSVFIYLGLLFFGFSQNKYLTRIYSLSFFLKKIFSKINFLPYRKLIILEFKK
ncbi:MAG: hypothetical protein PHX72_00740 [Candidatus Shapirobacteria bacterium]|nr:hypothetical protein [Candidatus Shapirobacteria bacterium]